MDGSMLEGFIKEEGKGESEDLRKHLNEAEGPEVLRLVSIPKP